MSDDGLLPVLRRWWRLLVAGALAGALLAMVAGLFAERTYEAQLKLLVGPVSAEYDSLQASGQLGRTYAELARSRRMVARAARRAGVVLTQEELGETVQATSNEVTRLVDVRVRRPRPQDAAGLADALATELRGLRGEVRRRESEQIETLMREDEVERLPEGAREGVRSAATRVFGASQAGQLQVVDPPSPPEGPVAPRSGLLMLLGALFGALAAGVFAVVREGIIERRLLADDTPPAVIYPHGSGFNGYYGEPDKRLTLAGVGDWMDRTWRRYP